MKITILMLNIRSKKSIYYYSDAQSIHKLLCKIYGSTRNNNKILYKMREDNHNIVYYIQAEEILPHTEKDETGRSYLITSDGIEKEFIYMGDIDVDNVFNKNILKFHLTVSPSKKLGAHTGKRIIIQSCEGREEWVRKKIQNAGGEIISLKEISSIKVSFKHSDKKGGKAFIPGYTYMGYIKVIDKEKLISHIKEGFGTGKCYGMGLMMVQ